MFKTKNAFTALFLFLAISIFVSSCQQEIDGDLPDPSTPTEKLKTYTEIILQETDTLENQLFNLYYNSNDKLGSLESVTHPGFKFVYHYTDKQFTLDIYQANIIGLHATYLLNTKSLIDSSFQYNIGETDTLTEKYTYNSSDWIASIKSFSNSPSGIYLREDETRLEYDAIGNVIKQIDDDDTITYTYYPDLKNPVKFFPQQQLMPYLVKTTTGNGQSLIHTYSFDSKNRLEEERAVDKNTGITIIKKYTYQ